MHSGKRNTCLGSLLIFCCLLAVPREAQSQTSHPTSLPGAAEIEGDWSGTLQAGDAQLHLLLHISRDTKGNLRGTLDSLDQGVYAMQLTSLFHQEATVSFELSNVGASYLGKISADRQFITGIWKQSGMGLALIFHRQPSGSGGRPSDAVSAVEGTWQGALQQGNLRLRLQLHVSHDADKKLVAGLDSLDEGVSGVPATHVSEKSGVLHFEVPVLAGTYEGTLNAAKNMLSGHWTQGGEMRALNFKRSNEVLEARRPQNPEKPYPYAEEEVKIVNAKAEVTLSGTLTLPRGPGPFAAALLVAGSGPHDRDETIAGHRPFLVLADYLTRRGIAVLRYDKRGFAKSTGSEENATTEDFAADADAAIAYLKTRKEIDPGRIGVIGHSEGAIIAPMLAAKPGEVAWIVLLAAPATTGEQTMLRQSELIARASGMSDDLLNRSLAFDRQAYALVREEKDRQALESKLSDLVQSSGLGVAMPPAALQAQIHMLSSPWFRYFLDYDPVPALRRVKCPVLALNGEKDLQVSPEDNLPVLKKALAENANRDVTVEELPGLNHLFQHCDTGSPTEYGAIEETMAPEVLQTIGDWVTKHTSSPSVAQTANPHWR
ncbi:MAG TPA: alpha/beta hydrolase [Terriglobales bacterium]|nr:alpha/beta hydrolase [Terriglobales bacterium]